VVHGLAQVLGAAARPHIEAVHAVAAQQSRLRETREVSRARRAFQAVQENNLAARRIERLMLERNYGRSRSYRIVLSDRWKALLVNLARPEVSGNCKQVRVAENWPELRQT
jgi:hypothetical protein